jgi:hypothetical protein
MIGNLSKYFFITLLENLDQNFRFCHPAGTIVHPTAPIGALSHFFHHERPQAAQEGANSASSEYVETRKCLISRDFSYTSPALRRELVQQRRQRIIREMIQELRHRIDPILAGRTAGHDNTLSALALQTLFTCRPFTL